MKLCLDEDSEASLLHFFFGSNHPTSAPWLQGLGEAGDPGVAQIEGSLSQSLPEAPSSLKRS